MEKIKSYVMFAAKVAVALIIVNAVLELIGGGVVANFISRPISTIKGLTGSGSAS